MKKFFFFKSSTDKQICVEHSSKSGPSDQRKKKDDFHSESLRRSVFNNQKSASGKQTLYDNSGLRRSRSFSSAAFLGSGAPHTDCPCLSDPSSSPSSCGSVKAEQRSQSFRCCPGTPDRHVITNQSQEVDYRVRKPVYSRSLQVYHDSCAESSLSSNNVSNEVLDLYIDGEQQNERIRPVKNTSKKDQIAHGGDKKPPRYHFTAPASPTGSAKDKRRYHSSRKARGSQLIFSSRGQTEVGFGRESPQDLAKHVANRLSSQTTLTDYESTVPITIEDVYNGSLSRSAALNAKVTHYNEFQSDSDYASTDGCHVSEYPCAEQNNDVSFNVDIEDELDVELKSKLKEAQERTLFLSEELEQESFLHDVEFNVPALVQRIKSLTEEKVTLALEVSALLESQLADRASMKEQIKSAAQRLQEEKNEMQSTLEKELDRRSSDWSLKVEKFQEEEQRLRERVRELAEQNVSLQREVSSLRERETERRSVISFSEKQVEELTSILEVVQGEKMDLQASFCELQDKCKAAEENRNCIQKIYQEKEEECRELHASITRLLRTCSQQEKTIDGLRGELAELVQRNHLMESSDKHVHKLQLEQIRLTGVEQALRKEVESYKREADSLRHENIDLLNRLRGYGREGDSFTIKLDHELWARLQCLQKQGLSLLKENTNLCSRLLESIKRGQNVVNMDGMEANGSCVDAQVVIESEVLLQGFRRGTESLMRSLQNIASVLDEKSSIAPGFQTQCMDSNGFRSSDERNSLENYGVTTSELKAEKLLTSLLREKLHAKDQEVEQLQAELATATRGIDILRCEVQNTLDSLSCATHKMKELELQMIKKEEKIGQLQNDLQESMKELTIIKGILPKVTQERDMMWQEVKQYTEKNMLLNSEVNMLKKKIEALDEDVLLKEGQITILKDSLGSKSFDLLASPDRTREFLLE